MNIRKRVHPMSPLDIEANRSGVGATALWDGPFDSTAFPKEKGNSAGIKGMELRMDMPVYNAGPITQRVKRK